MLCIRCGKSNKLVKGKNHCLECNNIYGRKYYKENKARRLKQIYANVKTYRAKLKVAVDVLKSRPCIDCGRSYPPYVMDFDHRRGEHKKANVAELVSGRRGSLKTVLAEIAKCDLLCANCHRERTHGPSRGLRS